MKYIKIFCQAYNRLTGSAVGDPRWEKINPEENELFRNAQTPEEVKAIFESFWNDLNSNSKEIVKCQDMIIA